MKFDNYTLFARVLPVYIVLLPIFLAGGMWITGEVSLVHIGSAAAIPLAVSVLLAHVGRDFGYKKQQKLWDSWDGPPATRFLRHRCEEFNSVSRSRYHKILSKLVKDIEMPTEEIEKENPSKADEAYGACVKYLIAKSRDKEAFPLVYKEVVSYGFRRNLWGMKAFGIVFSLIGLATAVAKIIMTFNGVWVESITLIVPLVLCLALLFVWGSIITKNWVSNAAKAYAERLLETCETLDANFKE
jgi:hypothetical protein